jgi:two-component system, OmpR family, KDP operon response regulator KdpE
MNAETHSPEVLIIDDEPQIRRLLTLILSRSEYRVREAERGQDGLDQIALAQPNLIILDLGLPDKPGLEVLRTLRAWTTIPVLVLSVFTEEGSKIAALDAGADDYLTKPFGSGELLARLRALQRRIKVNLATSVFRFGNIEVNFAKRLVTKDGAAISLTSMEYSLLQYFITHRGKVVTHRQILRDLWGPKSELQTHYLRTYMLRLRQKLEQDLDSPKHFLTLTGIGYRFLGDTTAGESAA